MKIAFRLFALVIVLFQLISPPPSEAFVSLVEIKADKLKGWIDRNKFDVRVQDTGLSWSFVLICPPADVKELQWGCFLQLSNNVTNVVNVRVKPRILTKGELKAVEGSVAFEFTFSKELLENSCIWMALEQKIPSTPYSEPHIYELVRLKELLPVSSLTK
jgi:hypothetical protein